MIKVNTTIVRITHVCETQCAGVWDVDAREIVYSALCCRKRLAVFLLY